MKTFHKVVFSIDRRCRMQLAIFVCVCFQSLLQIIVDGVGIVEVELRLGRIDIITSGSLKESAKLGKHVANTIKLTKLNGITKHLPHLALYVNNNALKHVGKECNLIQICCHFANTLTHAILPVVNIILQQGVERKEIIVHL